MILDLSALLLIWANSPCNISLYCQLIHVFSFSSFPDDAGSAFCASLSKFCLGNCGLATKYSSVILLVELILAIKLLMHPGICLV